jgi:hypothetical protein
MLLRLTYTPEGAPPEQFDFDPDKVLSLEAEALENVGGEAWDSYADWLDRIGNGNIRARRALLWVMLRRSNPELRFVDVVFRLDEFGIEDVEEPEPVGKESADGSPIDGESLERATEPSLIN